MNKNIDGFVKKIVKKVPSKTWKVILKSSDINWMSLAGTGDYDINEFVRKNGLNNPQKLARFLVDFHIGTIYAIFDEFDSIREDRNEDLKSKLQSADMKIKYAMFSIEDNERKNQMIQIAMAEIIDCVNVFKNDVVRHIDAIRNIDTQSQLEFF